MRDTDPVLPEMFVINPTDDDDYMGDVTVAITGTAGTLTVKDTELRLEDEDFDIELTVDQASLAIEEAGGTQSVTVTATAPADLDDATTVELWIVRPEGLTESTLALGGTTSLTIAGGTSTGSAVITIAPTEDKTFTDDRLIKVMGRSGSKDIKPARLMLIDAESAPTVTLAAGPKSLDEDGGAQDVTVTAKLSNAAGKDTDVAISVSEAMDNETGYEVDGPEKIVVPAGKTEMSATYTVTPDDNEAYDGNAMITFMHDNGDATEANPMVSVTLVDEDFDIELTASPDSITEKDAATQSVMITASMPDGKTASAATTVTLALDTDGNSNTLVNMAGTQSITIGTGASSASTTVTLTPQNDDANYNGDREIIIEGTSGTGADALDISPAKITLSDDESPPKVTLSISDHAGTDGTADDGKVNEDEGSINVTVTATLSAANLAQADTEVKVKVATNADRYTLGPENGEITITILGDALTNTTGQFSFTPKDDDDYMGDTTVDITGESGSLTVEATKLTLVDEDFDLRLMADPAFITEADGTQSVTVTATAPGGTSRRCHDDLAVDRTAGRRDRIFPGAGRNNFAHNRRGRQ